jgi:hypothetical protein
MNEPRRAKAIGFAQSNPVAIEVYNTFMEELQEYRKKTKRLVFAWQFLALILEDYKTRNAQAEKPVLMENKTEA